MKTLSIRDKVVKEIDKIPENGLKEIYNFIRAFRLRYGNTGNGSKRTIDFAGCWKSMPDKEFDDFTREIERRRIGAFSRRHELEKNAG